MYIKLHAIYNTVSNTIYRPFKQNRHYAKLI